MNRLFNLMAIACCLAIAAACFNNADEDQPLNEQSIQPNLNQPLEVIAKDLKPVVTYSELSDECRRQIAEDLEDGVTVDEYLNAFINATADLYIDYVDEDTVHIDVAWHAGDGVRFSVYQSKKDFMDNSSLKVNVIQLQWLDGSLNTEGGVPELVAQRVNGISVQLKFKLINAKSEEVCAGHEMLFEVSHATWPRATWPRATWPRTTWPRTTWPRKSKGLWKKAMEKQKKLVER